MLEFDDLATRDSYDVIVVGARVAGATVAALLGDAGYQVLLVDRDAFPSPTLSTHFFRGLAWLVSSNGWSYSIRCWPWGRHP